MKFALLNILIMFVVRNNFTLSEVIHHKKSAFQDKGVREAQHLNLFYLHDKVVSQRTPLFKIMRNNETKKSFEKISNKAIGYTSPNEATTLDLAQLCEEIAFVADGPLLDHQHCIDEMFEDSLDAKPALAKRNFQAYKVVNRIFLAAAQFKNVARSVWENVSNQKEL